MPDRLSVPQHHFTEDFELYQAAEILGTVGTFRGRTALDEVVSELRDAFDDVGFIPQDVHSFGPLAFLVVVRFTGIGRSSGLPINRVIAHVWRLSLEGARRLEVYWELADGMRAAGLSE